MKKWSIIAALMVIGIVNYSFKTQEQTYALKVKVNNLRNNSGVIQFALYDKDGSIPDEKYKKYYKLKIGEISKNSASITFNNLPKGKYAVNILHDEDVDGKIDKGWVLPTEGIGFSNISKIGIRNKPSFSKASFSVESDQTIDIKIIYL